MRSSASHRSCKRYSVLPISGRYSRTISSLKHRIPEIYSPHQRTNSATPSWLIMTACFNWLGTLISSKLLTLRDSYKQRVSKIRIVLHCHHLRSVSKDSWNILPYWFCCARTEEIGKEMTRVTESMQTSSAS